MDLKYDANGLIPAIVQDGSDGTVLMLGWMNLQSLELTCQTGEVHFWSRSRRSIWHKGETSGNTMRVAEMRLDCDADTILIKVQPAGPACHTGERSCFFTVFDQK